MKLKINLQFCHFIRFWLYLPKAANVDIHTCIGIAYILIKILRKLTNQSFHHCYRSILDPWLNFGLVKESKTCLSSCFQSVSVEAEWKAENWKTERFFGWLLQHYNFILLLFSFSFYFIFCYSHLFFVREGLHP